MCAKIISVVGARPNFMKIAPFSQEIEKQENIEHFIVHTGQHYDPNMNDTFFEQLQITKPKYNLGVGSGSHATQTAEIMTEFERICVDEKPDLVTVVGDVNSTIACALVARKLHIDVAHIESGLRSNDESMPEEINRILTDRISNLLFVSEQAGIDNLLKEGINPDKIYHSGNIMIDTLVNNLPHITAAKTYKKYDLSPQKYGVLTLHRPKNVDTQKELTHSLDIILEVQKLNTLIWPMHPRTKKNIQKYGLHEKINELTNVVFTEPLGYHDFMSLIKNSQFVLTDSGGIQEESTYLRIPCITLRENTERPSTVELGTNVITGLDKELILKYHNQIITDQYKQGSRPIFWDGNTAKRIVNTIVEKYV